MIVPRDKLVDYLHKLIVKALRKKPEVISLDIDLRGKVPKVNCIVATKTEDIEDFE